MISNVLEDGDLMFTVGDRGDFESRGPYASGRGEFGADEFVRCMRFGLSNDSADVRVDGLMACRKRSGDDRRQLEACEQMKVRGAHAARDRFGRLMQHRIEECVAGCLT